MAGGRRDSTRTRVAPVFDQLIRRTDDWPRQLIKLCQYSNTPITKLDELDLFPQKVWYGQNEIGLLPPLSLLSWLIKHPHEWNHQPDTEERLKMSQGDPVTTELALKRIGTHVGRRDWSILEGKTFPDAFIETKDALIVVEGKRTENGPTTHTKWMSNRHQIWRHIEGAWEIRRDRIVAGIFIVEGPVGRLPEMWSSAAQDTLDEKAIDGSLPHRSSSEIAELLNCFAGVTTWDSVCSGFGIEKTILPDTIDDLD